MNSNEILNKYIDLIDKGYCSDCNELNCIDNFPYAKITHAIRELQQENKILRENAEHNDKVVDKVNWENQLLKKENKQLQEELECTIGIVEHNRIISEKNKEIHQLKNNWNDLKKYAKEIISTDNELYGTDLLDKMQELEQGSDSNE